MVVKIIGVMWVCIATTLKNTWACPHSNFDE